MESQFLKMGKLGKAHGVKGEIGVFWHGETPLKRGDILYFGANGAIEPEPREILSLRPEQDRYIVRFSGVADRTEAQTLANLDVYVARDSLPPLAEGEAYLADLPGFRVSLADGEPIGILKRLEFPAGQEIWAIENDRGDEILFPARPEFIDSIDLANKEIRVSPPPGLLEIYRA